MKNIIKKTDKISNIAVKAVILNNNNEVLLIKRRPNDVHNPSTWEVPGGRLNPNEDPFIGLKRETKEETGLDIEIFNPLNIHFFTRNDFQKITMISFLCRLSNKSKKQNEKKSDKQKSSEIKSEEQKQSEEQLSVERLNEVILSEEHTDYKWLTINDAKKQIHKSFIKDLDCIKHFI